MEKRSTFDELDQKAEELTNNLDELFKEVKGFKETNTQLKKVGEALVSFTDDGHKLIKELKALKEQVQDIDVSKLLTKVEKINKTIEENKTEIEAKMESKFDEKIKKLEEQHKQIYYKIVEIHKHQAMIVPRLDVLEEEIKKKNKGIFGKMLGR